MDPKPRRGGIYKDCDENVREFSQHLVGAPLQMPPLRGLLFAGYTVLQRWRPYGTQDRTFTSDLLPDIRSALTSEGWA